MIDYGESPSMQMEIPGLGSEGEELMKEARRWAAVHYDEFQWFKRKAREESAAGRPSPNFMLQSMRHKFKVSVPNAYAPCLARIAMEQDQFIKFRLARSKVDGFTRAKL